MNGWLRENTMKPHTLPYDFNGHPVLMDPKWTDEVQEYAHIDERFKAKDTVFIAKFIAECQEDTRDPDDAFYPGPDDMYKYALQFNWVIPA